MKFSSGIHVGVNQRHLYSTFFNPRFRSECTIVNPLFPLLSSSKGTSVNSHPTAASLAGEEEKAMTAGHPHPAASHPPPHPHPQHHDTSLPAISAASAASAAAAASISPPSNTLTTTTSIHLNHTTANPTIAAAPTNAGISHVRLMCSYGGSIIPRPGDHLLRYVGGETRIISFPRTTSFSTLVSLLSSLSPSHFTSKSTPIIKYQLPHEDLDSLISVSCDEDLINMLDELDRSNTATKSPRFRLFLFDSSANGALASVLATGEPNQWFLDALNSAAPSAVGAALERRQSEASSSMLSDPPDYLTGIDNGSDRYSLTVTNSKNRSKFRSNN